MSESAKTERLGELRFEVEHRSLGNDGGGPTLRVRHGVRHEQGDAGRELLRFDCFRRAPHFHIDPGARDEITPIAAYVDPIEWTIEQLRSDLPGYLQKAGFTGRATAPEGLLRELEASLRNPPVDLDAVDLERMHSRLSEKWETYPRELLPAWVAEMDFPLARPIHEVLQRAVDKDDIGYPVAPADTGIREAFADRMSERFGWQIDPRHIEVLSDVVQGLYIALETFTGAGDGAIVQTPIYPPFLEAVRETGRTLVENRLDPSGQRFEIDFDALDAAIAPNTRILLLCHPHNPSGRLFSRSELEALAERVLRHDLYVATDEIHADLVYDGAPFVPFASLSPEISARTLTLTSATKAFNIPGLRCAVAHMASPELRRRFRRVPRHLRGGIGILGLYATIAAWRHSDPWLDQVRTYLESNRAFLREQLVERFPGARHHSPEATYLAWLDCSGLELPERPAAFFARHGGVALSEGANFGPGWDHCLRLNFATSRAILTQVLERMTRALEAR